MNICGRCKRSCLSGPYCTQCASEIAAQQEVAAAELSEKVLIESLLDVEYLKSNREQDRRIIALLSGHLRRALIDYENNHDHSLCGLETLEDLQLLEEN